MAEVKRFHRKTKKTETESPLSKGWPPAWSLSFSDLTTQLMAAFVLFYSLKVMNLPSELITVKQTRVTAAEKESMKGTAASDSVKRMIAIIKSIAPEKELAMISELTTLKELEDLLRKYIEQAGLQDAVDVNSRVGGILVTFRAGMLFAEGDAELKKDAFKMLDKVTLLLKDHPYYQLQIEGYTDNTPINPLKRYKFDSNVELSYARAVSVANYLISKGIPPSTIGLMGYGEQKPKYPNDSEENKTKNRRVEIRITFFKAKT